MTCPIRINDAVAHRTMRSTFTAGDGSPNGRDAWTLRDDECALLERGGEDARAGRAALSGRRASPDVEFHLCELIFIHVLFRQRCVRRLLS
ncbi:hypothetical protein [Burkholderia ubonensis]|uniref:hypothetical protein n=1 Tax=Burkholderia ubonensis TaxID=101571 RepID=UPI0012F859A3|nr:hypothetical protein [Burkholderia ubonensis]